MAEELKAVNENCLYGLECPKCGSLGPYDIIVESVARVHDDGIDYHNDSSWDGDSFCYCVECDNEGTISDFRIED